MSLNVILSLLLAVLPGRAPTETLVRDGSSPQLAMDTKGTIRMIFGREDTIFCVTSVDQGMTFGRAVVVGIVPGMLVGNTRGPVIASSAARSLGGRRWQDREHRSVCPR